MALGKNIKRQKLIPDDSEKPTIEKSVSKKKPVSKPRKKAIKKTTGSKKKKVVITETSERVGYITPEQFQYRQKIREKYNQEIDQLAGQALQMIVFTLDHNHYAIEISRLNEVVATPKTVSRIPHSPTHIVGAGNIRGNIVPLIDLEIKYQLKEKDPASDHPKYSMVVSTSMGSVGILTNDVPTTLMINGDAVEKISELVTNSILDESFVMGLIKADSKLISLIDVDEMLENEKIKVEPSNI